MVLGRAHQPPERQQMNPVCHYLETIMIRIDDKRSGLGKYWRNTIWLRKAQDRLTWTQHAEGFAQPNGCPMMMMMITLSNSLLQMYMFVSCSFSSNIPIYVTHYINAIVIFNVLNLCQYTFPKNFPFSSSVVSRCGACIS